jgi:hypothetical protein
VPSRADAAGCRRPAGAAQHCARRIAPHVAFERLERTAARSSRPDPEDDRCWREARHRRRRVRRLMPHPVSEAIGGLVWTDRRAGANDQRGVPRRRVGRTLTADLDRRTRVGIDYSLPRVRRVDRPPSRPSMSADGRRSRGPSTTGRRYTAASQTQSRLYPPVGADTLACPRSYSESFGGASCAYACDPRTATWRPEGIGPRLGAPQRRRRRIRACVRG